MIIERYGTGYSIIRRPVLWSTNRRTDEPVQPVAPTPKPGEVYNNPARPQQNSNPDQTLGKNLDVEA